MMDGMENCKRDPYVNPTEKPSFDGWEPYSQAIDFMKKNHIGLLDPQKREAWQTEWENKYTGTGVFRNEECSDKAIENLVSSLDYRFDKYLDAKLLKRLEDLMSGQNSGVGLSLADGDKGSKFEGKFVFEEVYEGGPAYAAGLRVGDTVTEINGTKTDGKTLKEVKASLRVEPGADVDLKVVKAGTDGKEQNVKLKSVEHYDIEPVIFRNEGDGTSYLRIRDFVADKTVERVKESLAEAAKGRGLIIDLRNNSGGRAEAAEQIAQMILPEGKYQDSIDREGDSLTTSSTIYHEDFVLNCETGAVEGKCVRTPREKPVLDGQKIVVLVDDGSASAAEILAGVLQSQMDVKIVGTPTKGKGEGQEFGQLSHGRGVFVTTHKFMPGGRDINWVGVVPDTEQPRSPDLSQDPQLAKAREVLREEMKAAKAVADHRRELEKLHRQNFENEHKK